MYRIIFYYKNTKYIRHIILNLTLESNQLIELNFASEFNIEAEQIIFDLESVWWVSNSSFEIPATINCNPYSSDTGCDGMDHDQVLKSNIYTYDIIANSFTKKAN